MSKIIVLNRANVEQGRGLSPQRILNVKKQSKVVGRGIKSSKKIENEVRSAINKTLKPMYEQLDLFVDGLDQKSPMNAAAELRQIQKHWEAVIDAKADQIGEAWTELSDSHNKKKTTESLRKALGVDISVMFDEPNMLDDLYVMRMEAAHLIRTIPDMYLNKVATEVYEFYRSTDEIRKKTLIQHLEDEYEISHNRAKTIARDQTAKINGNINAIRQTNLGIEEYVWRTARDQRVVGNPSGLYPTGTSAHRNHYQREGKKYRWDKPPEDGHPGQAIQCRCYAEPYIDLNKLDFLLE